jgi:transposase
VYEAFGVNSKSYYQWKKQAEETDGLQYNYPKSHAEKIDAGKILEPVKNHPDWYLSGFAKEFDVWPQAVHKKFKKLGVTRKKNFHLSGKIRGTAAGVFKQSRRNPGRKPYLCG